MYDGIKEGMEVVLIDNYGNIRDGILLQIMDDYTIRLKTEDDKIILYPEEIKSMEEIKR